MPPRKLAQDPLPDFSTQPRFHTLFKALVTGGHNREQATALIAEIWHLEGHMVEPQAMLQPLGPQNQPDQPQQHPNLVQQRPEHADQAKPLPLNHGQPPIEPQHCQQPISHNREFPAACLNNNQQAQAPHPVPPNGVSAPQDPPLVHEEDQDRPILDRANKRGPPPINLGAESITMDLQHPTTYCTP